MDETIPMLTVEEGMKCSCGKEMVIVEKEGPVHGKKLYWAHKDETPDHGPMYNSDGSIYAL